MMRLRGVLSVTAEEEKARAPARVEWPSAIDEGDGRDGTTSRPVTCARQVKLPAE
jgi:hypothetical protein